MYIIRENDFDELKALLTKLYFKYGNTSEIIELSTIIDKIIVQKQKQKMYEYLHK